MKRNRPAKKTDQNKPWAIRRPKNDRSIGTTEPNKLIFIVCEGQTESLYFESFPVTGLSVEAISLGDSKIKLVDNAISILKSRTTKPDETWVVFDMDAKGEEKEKMDFDNAIKKAHKNDIHVAYSNDAFELWFYLHFQYTDHKNHRTFYYKQLGQKFGYNYEKFGKLHKHSVSNYSRFQYITGSQSKAIQHVEKLFTAQKELPPHQQNPVTTVYQLVNLLNKNLRQ